MLKQEAEHKNYINQLEPEGILSAFIAHPPEGFRSQITETGLPLFTTQFDLLTTAEPALRQRLAALPGYRRWRKWLTLNTCFIGATTSEYVCLPYSQQPEAVLRWIEAHCINKQPLTIIKDLPLRSPLLSPSDNDYNLRLIAAARRRGFVCVEGQALAWVPIDFASVDEFLARMSHSRRRNIRRKLRSRDGLNIEVLKTGDVRFQDSVFRAQLYQQYLAVWHQSELHFDRLSANFFDHVLTDADSDGRLFCYWHQGELAGFNLCYLYQRRLIDKYIGFDYALAPKFNLYFVSWFVNLEYALSEGLQSYVAGWTDPEVKASLGASFTFTCHLVRMRNPLLQRIFRYFSHYFESDTQWYRQRVL
ncbi:GNAT family N-acetyltransferase [Erwinia sp. Eh17-17]|uniref:GNAT family N-acetyltransferase n=1 Tax=Erwinia sp. Eh17-17 TaxID=3080330 RepID=UPI00320A29CF